MPSDPKAKVLPIDTKKIWDAVQANWKALNECRGPHDFYAIAPERKLGGRFRCSLCLGEIDKVNKLWYEMGLKHGRERR
jgi:hypothetical protein